MNPWPPLLETPLGAPVSLRGPLKASTGLGEQRTQFTSDRLAHAPRPRGPGVGVHPGPPRPTWAPCSQGTAAGPLGRLGELHRVNPTRPREAGGQRSLSIGVTAARRRDPGGRSSDARCPVVLPARGWEHIPTKSLSATHSLAGGAGGGTPGSPTEPGMSLILDGGRDEKPALSPSLPAESVCGQKGGPRGHRKSPSVTAELCPPQIHTLTP